MCLASVRRKLRWRTPSYCRHVKVKICQDPLLTGNMLKHVSDRNGKPLQTAGALPKCLGNSEKLLKEFDLICNSLNKASTLLPACAESMGRSLGKGLFTSNEPLISLSQVSPLPPFPAVYSCLCLHLQVACLFQEKQFLKMAFFYI